MPSSNRAFGNSHTAGTPRRGYNAPILVIFLLFCASGFLASAALSFAAPPAAKSTGGQAAPPAAVAATPRPRPTRIAQENSLPGTDEWANIGNYDIDALAAFPAPSSVNAGGSVAIHLRSTGSSVTARLYRLGYYQDHGARLYATYSAVQTTAQPECTRSASTGLVSCAWAAPLTIQTDPAWISGIYLLRIDSDNGYRTFTYFVVRNDSYQSDVLVMEPTKTNQAYNEYDRCDVKQGNVCQEQWGVTRGESLYHSYNSEGRPRGYQVSFDRPFYGGAGTGGLFTHDIEMVRWLEASGYDVTYISDLDRAATPAMLLQHPVFLVMGHDEYWTWDERSGVEAARDGGTSIVFASGNESGWDIRLSDSSLGTNRIITCYKEASLDPAPDPTPKTVTFRDLNRPENSLVGAGYQSWYEDALYNAPWSVTDPAGRWYFDCTGLQTGDQVNNIVGEEWDAILNNGQTPPGTDLLSSGTVVGNDGITYPQQTTLYTAASGAMVFGAGSIHWSWGLMDHSYANQVFEPYALSNDADPRIQQLTANILDRFAGYWDGAPRSCTGQSFYKTAPRPTRTPKPEPPTATGTRPTGTPTNTLTPTRTRTAAGGTATSIPSATVTSTPGQGCAPISWQDLVNVTAQGSTIQKTGGVAYQWDAGATSAQEFSGDMFAQSVAADAGSFVMFGLSHQETTASYTDIDFGIYLAGGQLKVSESAQGGAIYGPFGTYAAGDVLRVEVQSGVVRYYKNGGLFYTSTHAPVMPLHFDSSLSDPGSSVLSAAICRLVASSTPSPTLTAIPSATSTQTPTRTPTATQSSTATATPTNTATNSPTRTSTRTYTSTPTVTATPTYTFTPTSTPSSTLTATNTPTATPSSTRSSTIPPASTSTPTSTYIPTYTSTKTGTPAPSGTGTSTSTSTFTPTSTGTATPASTYTPGITPTSTFISTASATASATSTPLSTSIASSTSTATQTRSATATAGTAATYTSTPMPQPSSTTLPSQTAGSASTSTATSPAAGTPTASATETETQTQTTTPSSTRTVTAASPTSTLTTGPSTTATMSAHTPTPTGTPLPLACTASFTDVLPGSTFYTYIEQLACEGAISGYADGTFRPQNLVTRGQLSKIVSLAAGLPPYAGQSFEDVPPGAPFFPYVEALYGAGYISGYPCGGPGEACVAPGNLPYFRPAAPATRGQIAKIISNTARFADVPLRQSFEDVPPSSPFYSYIYRLAMRSVISGYSCGGVPDETCVGPDNLPYFRPQSLVTRGQTSKMVAITFLPRP